MKRTKYTGLLRQRRLVRKFTRRSARRSKVLEWNYRDHMCSVGVDVVNTQFVGRISNMNGECLVVANQLDELLVAFHHKVDAHLRKNSKSGD